MHHAGKLTLIAGIIFMGGCSIKNLKEPNYVDIFKPVKKADGTEDYEDARLAPILNMQNAYAPYRDGAATNKTTLSAIALGGAGVAAVGLATNSHSDLYKSSAAIIATAFGLEGWGNFKGQFSIYDGALNYLACARTHTKTIIDNEDLTGSKRAISSIRSNDEAISNAYGNSVIYTAVSNAGGRPAAELDFSDSEYKLPDNAGAITPTLRQTIRASAVADAEIADLNKANEILANHRAKVETDMQALQSKITKAISESSFDTEKAIAVIAPKLAKPPSQGGDAEKLINSTGTDSAMEKAHAIIDAYNSYQLCSTSPKAD